MDIYINNKQETAGISFTDVFFLLLILLTVTFLRISLLLIYPFLVVVFLFYFRMKVMRILVVLLIFIALGWLLSLLNGWYPVYNMISLYYMIPFLFLLFSVPSAASYWKQDLVVLFFRILTPVMLINNLVGFLQVIYKFDTDDEFTGLYASFTLSQNGLAIINSILSFYYLALYSAGRKNKDLIWFLFFFMSGIMGFFGGGLIAFALSTMLSFIGFNLARFIKAVMIVAVIIVAAYYSILLIRPKVLRYNKNNISDILSLDLKNGPRKGIAFYNYCMAYPAHPKDFLFGSGPGTFNSRTAFMVGSPSYFTAVRFFKCSRQPYYFKNYAYTLWNETNTSPDLFQDGYRNQPFSSILSFLGEYGVLFTLLFMAGYIAYFLRVMKILPAHNGSPNQSYRLLFRFLTPFLFLLLLIDNFLEYPEIILPIVIIMKLLHIELLKGGETAAKTHPQEQ